MENRKKKNRKILVHFTLAIGLIAGVWLAASSNSSGYEKSPVLVKEKKQLKEAHKAATSNKVDIKSKKSALEIVAEIEKADNVKPVMEVADLRSSFDVTDADQVKNMQKILGLKEDGIFGPETEAAYKAAIDKHNQQLAMDKNNNQNPSNAEPQTDMEIKSVVSKPGKNLTTLNTKAPNTNNNAMLD